MGNDLGNAEIGIVNQEVCLADGFMNGEPCNLSMRNLSCQFLNLMNRDQFENVSIFINLEYDGTYIFHTGLLLKHRHGTAGPQEIKIASSYSL